MMTHADASARWLAAVRGALLLIAFLLGLTTARNSELWAHLASGRAALAGNFHAPFLPFSWLADVGLFGAFSALGGTGLVVGKALVAAGIAAVLLRPAGSWQTALAVLPAVIALGNWLPLDPIVLSYLFLAIAVSATESSDGGGWREQLKRHWPLLVLLAIWANVDGRCWLGSAVIGVAAIGRSIGSRLRGEALDAGPWRLFVLAILATCISPLPFHAPALGNEITTRSDIVEFGVSPFHKETLKPLREFQFEGTVPVLAFWLLAFISLLSFRSAAPARVLGRFLPWLGLLAVSVWSVRFVPFFTVVAGAALVRNLREAAASAEPLPAPATTRPISWRDRGQTAARIGVAALAALGLLAAAWVGWLQRSPAERRNWTLEPDPSLVRAARQVEEWTAAGSSQGKRIYFTSRDAADLFAWFAPRAFLSGQIGFPGDLTESTADCLVLSDANRRHFLIQATMLQRSPWKLAYLRGRVAVFVGSASPLAAVDLPARAFGAAADRAPPSAPPMSMAPPRWYEAFLRPRDPRSLDRDEAVIYALYEDATLIDLADEGARRFLAAVVASMAGSPQPLDLRWTILAAAEAASPKPPKPAAFARFGGFFALTGISADHYLALRAARRGVAEAPRSAAAYDTLGKAYLHLLANPLEASWGSMFGAARRLRMVQAATALRQAVTLDPHLPDAHFALANIYGEQGFFDLATEELQAYARLTNIPEAAQRAAELTRELAKRRQATEANAANLSVLDRARLAQRNELVGQALQTLLQSDVASFGAAGMAMELELLLRVGRAAEADTWLAEEHRTTLGPSVYDWLRFQSAAAEGNYAAAAAILKAQVDAPLAKFSPPSLQVLWTELKALRKTVAEQPSFPEKAAMSVLPVVQGFLAPSRQLGRQISFELQTRTQSLLLLALLALEEGDMASCSAHLERIEAVWKNIDERGDRYPSPARTIARQMASLLRR